MSQELLELIKRVDALSPDEQLYLISYIVEKIRLCEIKQKPPRNLTELEGIAPNLLAGMDAQEYVTRLRRGEFPDIEIEAVQAKNQA
jgi:hypothetical protein